MPAGAYAAATCRGISFARRQADAEATQMRVALTGLACLVALVAAVGVRTGASEQAIQAKGSMCGVMDGDGSFHLSTSSQTVTNSGGVSMHRCSARNVPNSTGRVVRWNYDNTGMMCWTADGPTPDWQETVSASGQATLICHHRD
jgi:glucose dehydrogenase